VITDYDIIKESPKYHHVFQLYDKSSGVQFTDIMEINTLELQKIPEESDSTAKYNWLKFLKAEGEEEFNMIGERRPAIKKAVVELKRLSQDEEAQRLYEAREKAIRDENSRLKTALRKRDKEIAQNLIKIGLTNDQISEATKLSAEEIAGMRN
jgi:predicted transposase/invertase (TIGR01784 family)